MNSKMLWTIVALAVGFVSTAVGATNLVLVGTPSYSITGSNLGYSSSVQNASSSTSATIRMEMWVFPTPYSGGSLAAGYKLADEGAFASPLSGGFMRTHSVSGPYAQPPYGLWNVALIWTEQDGGGANGGFSPRAYGDMGTQQFGTATPPNVPTSLHARAISPTEIDLGWDASRVNGVLATSYEVYVDGAMIGTVDAAGAAVFGLSPSTTYSFAVAACDAAQNCSLPSTAISSTTLAAGSASLANFTGLWWDADESGWGLNVSHQGNIVFATLFTYDLAGKPLWLVMSHGAMQGNATIFSGELYLVTGPPFNANPFTPIGAGNLTQVGTMTLAFTSSGSATLTYSVNGNIVVKTIALQVFGSRIARCVATSGTRTGLTNYQDLWWNPTESGWGMNITQQDDTIFSTLFTYDATGKALWLVMSNGAKQADGSYYGALYETTGPAFNAQPFTPIGAGNFTQVGTMRLQFSDGVTGTLVYSVNGVTVIKAITREEFATPTTSCTS